MDGIKKQIVVIHGGDTFDTYKEYSRFLMNYEINLEDLTKKGWKKSLDEKLGDDFEVIAPKMPCSWNAKYDEWKLWFEKHIPFIKDEAIFIGHSLGGIFLVKYLSENNFPKKIKATFLIAAPHDEDSGRHSLSSFTLPENLDGFGEQAGKIYLYHSKDDPVVPFTQIKKYKEVLPNAKEVIFEDKEHFSQEEFPELLTEIAGLYK